MISDFSSFSNPLPLIFSAPGWAITKYFPSLGRKFLKTARTRLFIKFLATAFLATFLETEIISLVSGLFENFNLNNKSSSAFAPPIPKGPFPRRGLGTGEEPVGTRSLAFLWLICSRHSYSQIINTL